MQLKKRDTSAPDPIAVGARIRALRHEAAISQSGLANILGISPGAVGNWEQGQGCPTLKQGLKICTKFSVSLDYIFRGEIQQLAQGRGAILAELEELKHDPSGANLGHRRP